MVAGTIPWSARACCSAPWSAPAGSCSLSSTGWWARGVGLETANEIFILGQLDTALRGRMLLASAMSSASSAAVWGVLDLFFLVALRVVLRRWWLAIALFIGVNGLFETLEGIHPAVSWLTLGLGIAGVTAFLLVRFGLLTYATALFCYFFLLDTPITASSSAWFAETGLFAVAGAAAVGLLGWRAAVAETGRPVARVEPEPAG